MKYLIIVLLATAFLQAQDKSGSTIIAYPGNPDDLLEQKWDWAETTGEKQDGSYWIGYAFKRLMNENSFFGCYHEEEEGNSSLLENIKLGFQPNSHNLSNGYRHTTIGDSGKKVMKPIAVLFHIDDDIEEIGINNLSLPFDLQSDDLYWMGSADIEQSIDKLIDIYQSEDNERIDEKCIMAIGIHQDERAFVFLKEVIREEKNPELRETAVFWLAESGFEGAFEELNWVIENDPSLDVREHAIFGFYLINSDQGDNALIKNAREAKDMEIRKKAIFWLSQRASKKAVETLEFTVFEEKETELQTHAVFALSQLENNKGLPSLIKAAKDHPNPQVRKKAIFWLGQMEDDRALDVLVDIIQN